MPKLHFTYILSRTTSIGASREVPVWAYTGKQWARRIATFRLRMFYAHPWDPELLPAVDTILKKRGITKGLRLPSAWTELAQSERSYLTNNLLLWQIPLLIKALTSLPEGVAHVMVVSDYTEGRLGIYGFHSSQKLISAGPTPVWALEVVRHLRNPVPKPPPLSAKTQWDHLLDPLAE